MGGIEGHEEGLGGISRARFLKLAGLGSGLSLFPGALLPAGRGWAQAVGGAEILEPNGPYPIVAWWPPPPVPGPVQEAGPGTNELYAELAGAGFNAVIGGNNVANNRANGLALDACEANGLRLVLADSDLRNAIDGTAPAAQGEPDGVLQALNEQDSGQDLRAQATADRTAIAQRLEDLHASFGEHPALAGIFLYDEPGRSMFRDLQFAKEEVERIFGLDELPYVNVWPSYASPKDGLEAPSYQEYLDFYLDETRYPGTAVAPPFLSFDHYPLLTDERVTGRFFHNHAIIRNYSLRYGVPSWGFVQSMGFDGRAIGLGPRRRPDEAEIFWQINVALAYGVKGIQYFAYWTPQDDQIRFGDALITREGARTPLYDYAARANDSLRKIGAVLLPLTSSSVAHALERRPPRGAVRFTTNPYVGDPTGNPAILSFFDDPADPANKYMLVTNRSPNRVSRTRLTVSRRVRSVLKFDASVEPAGAFVPSRLTRTPPRRYLSTVLGPGRARLYRLRTA